MNRNQSTNPPSLYSDPVEFTIPRANTSSILYQFVTSQSQIEQKQYIFCKNIISRPTPDPKDVSANQPDCRDSILITHLHPSRHVHQKRHTSSSKCRKAVSLLGQMLKSLCYNGARILWTEQERTSGWWNEGPLLLYYLLILNLMQRVALSVDWVLQDSVVFFATVIQSYGSIAYKQCTYLTPTPF
jgi:hypothetical protein